MLRLTKKLMFAIEAVVDIAYNAADLPVQSGDVAERQGIPRRYLEQVLQHLVRVGILKGQRGPRGGYRLARERRRITLGEIVRVVGEIEGTTDPLEAPAGSELGKQVLRPIWVDLQEETLKRLDAITIDDVCSRARELGIDSRAAAQFDFMI
ncbi:MAG: Rrf2 family transcriptional regulator [Alphaproteobacteria bacterium]